MEKLEPLTLVFAPKFGIDHMDKATGEILDCIDLNLAGGVRVFRPINDPAYPRMAFDIGRAPSCWIEIGKQTVHGTRVNGTIVDSVRDSVGNSYFNRFSRVQATVVLDHNPVAERLEWVIMVGGVFIDPATGERVSITNPPSGVYLNGVRLKPNDKEPLFPRGEDEARLSLGLNGRIILKRGDIGEHSTAWPAEAWKGKGWPTPDQVHFDELQETFGRLEMEEKSLQSKDAVPLSREAQVIQQLNATPVQRVLIYAVIALCVIALVLLIGGR